MFLWLLACSVELMMASETSIEEYQTDSGDWGLADQGEADSSVEDGFAVSPAWWKLFAEMQWDVSAQQYDVTLSRMLYDSDFDEICRQSLTATEVTLMNSPIDEGVWITMDLTSPVQECDFQREDSMLMLGVGTLFSDLEIALQMVDWMDTTEQNLYQDTTPFGGYASFGTDQDILAFAAAFATDGGVEATPTTADGDWIIRPIYAFKW